MNDSKRPRVLIVEDNSSYREMYEEILKANFNLEIVGSKEDAFACLHEQTFDVALVDMRLKANEEGNTDGLDVIQFIRDLNHPTVIILKSGYPTDETPKVKERLDKLAPFAVLDKSTENQVQQLKDAVSRAAAEQGAKAS